MRFFQLLALTLWCLSLQPSYASSSAGPLVPPAGSRVEYDGLFDRLQRLNVNDRVAVASSFGTTFSLSSESATHRFWRASTSSDTLPSLRMEYGERTGQATQRSNFLSVTIPAPRLTIEEVRGRFPEMSLVGVSYGHEPRGEMIYEVDAGNVLRLGFEGSETLLRTIMVTRRSGAAPESR